MRFTTEILSLQKAFLLFLHFSICQSIDLRLEKRKDLMQYGNFDKRIKDLVFNKPDSLVLKAEADSDVKCASQCIMHPSCLAVNFGTNGTSKFDCELLNWGGTSYRKYLVKKPGFFHMRLENVCTASRDPCGSKRLACAPHVTSNQSFVCYCPNDQPENLKYCAQGDQYRCNGLGLSDHRINNSQITASSYHSAPHWLASNGRLFNAMSWYAAKNVPGEWLQVRFTNIIMVTGIVSQGHSSGTNWFTQYYLAYDVTGNLVPYKENGIEKNFHYVVSDPRQIVKFDLKEPFLTIRVRFVVTAWNGAITGRFEVYGC